MKRRAFLSAIGCTLGGLPLCGFAQRTETLAKESADLIVIGSGAAGLSAALSAAETARAAGKKLNIVLFEKNAELGGDTLIAGGYFNAVDPARQKPFGINDSTELFEKQMLDTAAEGSSAQLVRVLAVGATEAIQWLESYGMVFLPEVYSIFGSPFPRAHKPVLPSGRAYVQTLTQAALAEGVQIRQSCAVSELIYENNRIRGVVYRRDSMHWLCEADSVVIASGGFAGNRQMLTQYAPSLANLPVDTQPGSTGDLHLAAQRIGADLVNMSFLECIPGAGGDIGYHVRLDYMPNRMILVNESGQRFVDETSSRFEIASAIVAQTPKRVWAVADSALVAELDVNLQKNLYRGLYAAAAHRQPTLKSLSRSTGIRFDGLNDTMHQNPARQRIQIPPFWAVPVHLRVHATLGGIRISPEAQVLDTHGCVLPGLWAAGAATGGVHGRNRMGGNGINTAVVFGRIAGRNAALCTLARGKMR